MTSPNHTSFIALSARKATHLPFLPRKLSGGHRSCAAGRLSSAAKGESELSSPSAIEALPAVTPDSEAALVAEPIELVSEEKPVEPQALNTTPAIEAPQPVIPLAAEPILEVHGDEITMRGTCGTVVLRAPNHLLGHPTVSAFIRSMKEGRLHDAWTELPAGRVVRVIR